MFLHEHIRKTHVSTVDLIERIIPNINNTTNKIVGNDLIKQQADEAKKQQLVEKEMEEDSKHYQEDLEKLDEAAALQDISHMPARVKCAMLGWRTMKQMLGVE